MTDDDRRPTDWDNARLAAAFQARTAARTTPHDLADAAIDAVRRDPTSGTRVSRWTVIGGLAAAAAIAAVALVLAFPRGDDRSGDTPSTFGLPILSVSQAAAVRDRGVDGQEIAVSGFFATAGAVPCPMMPFQENNPAAQTCPPNWLMEQPDLLFEVTDNGTSFRAPAGPAIRPGMSLIMTESLPKDPRQVVPVVMIGHFDDRRARLCPAANQQTCADTFLVDRIQQVGDAILPTGTLAERTPILDPAAVDAAVTDVDPQLAILSRRVVDSNHLSDTEPLLATARFSHFAQFDEPLVWVVTAIVPSPDGSPVQPRTFIVPDGSSIPRIGEITADTVERIDLVASAEPTSTATPSPSDNPATTWLGAPITVSEAIDHRDNHLDDTELAVKGFAWAPQGPIACTAIRPGSPALDQCPDGFTHLAERIPGPQPGPAFLVPDGPAIGLLVRPETYRQVEVGDVPRAVIVLGHFDDHRSISCAPDLIDQCRHNFLVDAILDPDAPGIDRNAIEAIRPDPDVHPVASVEDVERAVPLRGPRGADWVIAAFVVSGSAITSYEPQAAESLELTSASAVWVIRYLELIDPEQPIVRTAMIVDGPVDTLLNSVFVPTPDGLGRVTTIID